MPPGISASISSCCYPGCFSPKGKLFPFPLGRYKHKKRKDLWMSICGLSDCKYKRICQKHFDVKYILTLNETIKLSDDAEPYVDLLNQPNAKETENYKSTHLNNSYADAIAGIDFTQLSVKSCLVCLKHKGIISIYDASETITFASKIKCLADITLIKDIGFPSSICTECADNINNAYKLRKQCQNSFKIFSTFVKNKIPNIHCEKAIASGIVKDSTNQGEMGKVPPDAFCSVFLPEPILTNENTILQSNEIKQEADDFMYKNTGVLEEISPSIKSEPINISELDPIKTNESLLIESFICKEEYSINGIVENIDIIMKKDFVSHDSNLIPKKSIEANIIESHSDQFACDDVKYYEFGKYFERNETIRNPVNNDPKCVCEICGTSLKTLSILHNHLKLHESKIDKCPELPKVCKTSALSDNHSKIRNRRRRHKCDQCKKKLL